MILVVAAVVVVVVVVVDIVDDIVREVDHGLKFLVLVYSFEPFVEFQAQGPFEASLGDHIRVSHSFECSSCLSRTQVAARFPGASCSKPAEAKCFRPASSATPSTSRHATEHHQGLHHTPKGHRGWTHPLLTHQIPRRPQLCASSKQLLTSRSVAEAGAKPAEGPDSAHGA